MSWPAKEPSFSARRDEGRQPRRFLGRDRRHVERVGDRAGEQVVGHLLGDLQGDVLLRLAGRGAQVRRADDVRRGRTAAFSLAGSLDEHVERRRRATLPDFERRGERLLVDQAAAGAVDDAHALLHLGDRRRVDDVLASSSVSGVCRVMKSARRQQLVELDLLDAELDGALLRQEGVEGDDLHLQADGAVGDDRADIAAADHAERLAGDLDAHEAVLLPLAGLGRGVGGGSWRASANIMAMACSAVVIELPKGVFITMMPRRGGRRHVDVVDADAGAADDLEVRRGGEQLVGDLGGRADGEAVVVADDGERASPCPCRDRAGSRRRRRGP